MDKPLALNVGCGTRHADFEGYETKNVDLRPDVKPDLKAAADDLPFAKESVGLIHLSHLLEHFTFVEGRKLLRYYHGLLVQSGKLWIVVPNLEYAAVQIMKDGYPDGTSYDILYGHQEYETNFHKCGFTPRSLKKHVEALGCFKVLSVEERMNGFEISLKAESIYMAPEKPGERFMDCGRPELLPAGPQAGLGNLIKV